SINNKYINGIKADIGLYLQTSGASATSIDTLANLGLSVSRITVNRQKKLFQMNMNNLLIIIVYKIWKKCLF
ncbi:hypothetical protein RhiirA5_447194, partial [Rhizophagus irregularis]